jgi:hypothetical protein
MVPCQIGVFGEVLEVPAAEGAPLDVEAGPQDDADTEVLSGFGAPIAAPILSCKLRHPRSQPSWQAPGSRWQAPRPIMPLASCARLLIAEPARPVAHREAQGCRPSRKCLRPPEIGADVPRCSLLLERKLRDARPPPPSSSEMLSSIRSSPSYPSATGRQAHRCRCRP